MHFSFHKILLAVVFIFVFGFLIFSRFFLLDLLPATIPHDEMAYAVQAKSYVVQVTTLDQIHRPWFLVPFDNMYAELPATLMSLGFLFSRNPLIGAHLTSALMGITLPFILAFFGFGLWKRKDVALGLFVVAVFNPFFWQFSRLGYDVWYSLWFYLAGAALMVQDNKKLSRWAPLLFFLGFFNYQGFKILLLPWTIIVFLLKSKLQFLTKKPLPILAKFKWQIFTIIFACILTLIYGFILLPNQPDVKQRLGKTIFSDTQKLAELVNLERRQTFISPLLSLYANKATITLNFMLDRFASAFDLNLLFLQIEPAVSGFSVWVHGIFYWIEGLFILIGTVWLLGKKQFRLSGIILLASIPLLSLPTLINSGSEWHLLRTMLSYTVMLILAGVGVGWLVNRKWLRVIIAPIYLLAILNFSYIYFYRYPVISLDWGNYHERLIAHYVSLTNQTHPNAKISVHVGQPNYYYWSYLLYSNRISNQTKSELAKIDLTNKNMSDQKFVIDNVTFTNSCEVDENVDVMLAESSFKFCKSVLSQGDPKNANQAQNSSATATINKRSINSIVAILDSGEKIYILDDQLCQGKKLKSYVYPTTFDDINIEKLDADQFCLNWISDQAL